MQTLRDQIRRRHGDDSGFTLIELLVVIVIIGILSAVVIFSVSGISERGNDAACKSDRSTLKVAEEAYFAKTDPGVYTDEAGLVTAGLIKSVSTKYDISLTGTSPNYTAYALTVQDTKCTGVGV